MIFLEDIWATKMPAKYDPELYKRLQQPEGSFAWYEREQKTIR